VVRIICLILKNPKNASIAISLTAMDVLLLINAHCAKITMFQIEKASAKNVTSLIIAFRVTQNALNVDQAVIFAIKLTAFNAQSDFYSLLGFHK
jgi:hypothetical protein